MANVPLQGYPGVWDKRNPTVVPNMDQGVMANGVLGAQSPAQVLANNPRVDATAAATIGGTITNGNIVTLIVTNAILPGGSLSFAYTVQTADTLSTVAEGLASLINASAVAGQYGIEAYLGGTGLTAQIVVHWNGPVGNSAVLSATSPGTETVTLAPSNGVFSGGSGPVIATSNNQFVYNGQIISAWYGKPYFWDSAMISAVIAQAANMPGQPIV